MMFKNIIAVVVATFGVFLTSSVFGYTINTSTYVGVEDTLLTAGILGNSGDETEANFFNTELSTTYSGDDILKTDFSDKESDTNYVYNYWILVDGENDIYAFDLKENGGYYLVKTGAFKVVDEDNKNVTGVTLPDTFLFQNNTSENYAVVSLSTILSYLNDYLLDVPEFASYEVTEFDLEKISHVSETGDPSVVPEPATMLLFGTGIAGLAGIARRKRS